MTGAKVAAAAVVFALLAGAAFATEQTEIHLDVTAQTHLGLRIQIVQRESRPAQVTAFAKVLDSGPLAQLESDLTSAQAAAEASRTEARRLTALRGSVQGASAKDVEAAVSSARQDQAKVQLLTRRVGLEWGPGIASLTPTRRSRLLNSLAAGRLALVHIDTPSNEGQDKARSAEIDLGASSVHAIIIGPARAAEPRLQSSGLIGLVSGPQAVRLSNGLTQSAHLNLRAPVAGVLVPRQAVIRHAGSEWVYVQTAPSAFQRVHLDATRAEKDGVFVSAGLQPGSRVVVAGVGGLLTADLGRPAGGF
jgi:hypothetical protein